MRTRDENKEQAIRENAIDIVIKHGLEGLSMQKLAKAAGVSPATIYIYFKDREDFLVKLSVDIATRLLTASLKDFDPDMSFEEGLRIQWKNRAAFFMEHPNEVHFIEQIRYSPLYEKVMPVLTSGFSEIMGKFVHNAIRRKELKKLPFEVYWSVAFAPLYQLMKFHAQGRSYASENFVVNDKIMAQTLELVVKALRPE
jgi:TetR/AcrR family transcriptional regulator, multidrug resistance operon repressor